MTIHPLTLSEQNLSTQTAKNNGSGLLDDLLASRQFTSIIFFSVFGHCISKNYHSREHLIGQKSIV